MVNASFGGGAKPAGLRLLCFCGIEEARSGPARRVLSTSRGAARCGVAARVAHSGIEHSADVATTQAPRVANSFDF